MAWLRAMLLGIALVPLGARLASAQRPITIEVQETAGIRRFQYPVAVRLQLEEPMTRETGFRLLLDDTPVLAQFRPAEQGEAVSAWWLDFPVDLLPYQTLTYRGIRGSVTRRPGTETRARTDRIGRDVSDRQPAGYRVERRT